MRDHYDFTNARPNPYAEKMKNGYSVAIHYETPEDAECEDALRNVLALLKQPGLNALHLYIKRESTVSVSN